MPPPLSAFGMKPRDWHVWRIKEQQNERMNKLGGADQRPAATRLLRQRAARCDGG